MSKYHRVWIIGTGAVGSALAGLLHDREGIKVCLVGGSVHWRAIREKGLDFEIKGQGSEVLPLATAGLEEVPPLGSGDLALLTGKLPDLEGVLKVLKPKIGPEATIIALQNGLGADRLAAEHLGRRVERGLLFFGANCPGPGRVIYNPGIIRLQRSPASEPVAGLLEEAPIRCELKDDFRPIEWFKMAINCVANPLAGLLGANNEEIRQPVLDSAKEAILAEVRAVAKAEGVDLSLTVDFYNDKIKGHNVPSMRADLVRGRPTEIDFLNGAVADLGRKHGLPTPANDLLVGLVRFVSQKGVSV